MASISHILYDLGNTLLYFDGDWEQVFDRAVRRAGDSLGEAGIADVDPARFRTAFADSFRAYYVQREIDLLEKSAAHVLTGTLERLGCPAPTERSVAVVLDAFYGVTQAQWKPVSGVHETLSTLQARGIRQGVLSNASHDADVQALVDGADLRRYMDFVLSSAAIGLRKPHETAFRHALAQWSTPPDGVLMVGDTPSADIRGASAVGIRSVWVTRYAGIPDGSGVEADVEIEELSELVELVDNFE